jgi:16S rRNA processing protein RimM
VRLVVGRVGRAHGTRGEVAVEVRTDDPDRRFAPGSAVDTEPPEHGPLRVEGARPHSGRLLVRFEGIADRTAAERLRGALLTVDSADAPQLGDPDEFYDHQLVGLAVVTVDGSLVGTVDDVLHPPGPGLLAVATGQSDEGSAEVLVPFVKAIVVSVDVTGGRLVIDPPPGLLDLGEAE